MTRGPIVRRPHGPINTRFSRMYWDDATGKIKVEELKDEEVLIQITPPGPYVDPRQRGATE